MENPTASELIKKLAEGKISREEFELFLAKLDDKGEAKSLDEGFWQLFAQQVSGLVSEQDKGTKSNE